MRTLTFLVGWLLGATGTARVSSRRVHSIEASRDAAAEAEADLCAAEYSAMMGKIQAWASYQYTCISLDILALTLLAQLWGKAIAPEILLWAAAIIIAVTYIAYQNAMLEGLRAVLYIEAYLRPRAMGLARSTDVLAWERFLRIRRGANVSESPYWPPLISLVVAEAMASGRLYFGWTWWDTAGNVAVLSATILVAVLTSDGLRLWTEIRAATADVHGIEARLS